MSSRCLISGHKLESINIHAYHHLINVYLLALVTENITENTNGEETLAQDHRQALSLENDTTHY